LGTEEKKISKTKLSANVKFSENHGSFCAIIRYLTADEVNQFIGSLINL